MKKKLGRVFLCLLFAGLSVATFVLIIVLWNYLGTARPYKPMHLTIIPLLVLEYALTSLIVVGLVALKKGGWDKLKKFSECGLVHWLVVGLAGGLVIGGLVWGIFGGLFGGLVYGLVYGLAGGLVIGGLVWGLAHEFD